MNLQRAKDLVAEINDSLPDTIDVARGLEGPTGDVLQALELISAQAVELEKCLEDCDGDNEQPTTVPNTPASTPLRSLVQGGEAVQAKVQVTCPKCLGKGYEDLPVGSPSHMVERPCDRCKGTGKVMQ